VEHKPVQNFVYRRSVMFNIANGMTGQELSMLRIKVIGV
jgi:hypothetical protein